MNKKLAIDSYFDNRLSESEMQEALESEQIYTEGKIVEYSWGYEQTNIDYYLIVKRSKHFAWLQPIGEKNRINTGDMNGTCEPDATNKLNEPIIRRKVKTRDGQEIGFSINDYGWASLWDGEPSQWSSYG